MTATMTRYQTAEPAGRDGFAQLLRSEWTKFRTVRGWKITLLVVLALTAAVPIWLASTATSNDPQTCTPQGCQVEGRSFATGPAGTAVIDSFYFVHQAVGTSGSLTARVADLHGTGKVDVSPGFGTPPTTEPWAKAGLIIKASTKPGAAYAAIMLTGSHGVRMQYDFSHDQAGPAAAASAATWLRLTRSGDAITGWTSANGRSWSALGTVRLAGLPASAQAGLFVTSPDYTKGVGSGDNSVTATTQSTASFTGLALTGATAGGHWTGTAVGTNSAQVSVGPTTPGPAPDQSQTHVRQCLGGCAQTGSGYTRTAGRFTLTGTGDIAPFIPIVDPMHVAFLATLFGLIAAIGLGVVFVTAEYRRSLIRLTVAATPRRGRILVAKSIVVGGATFVAALIGAAIAFPVAGHELAKNGWKPPVWPDYSLLSSTGLQVVLGTAAIAAGAAVLALAAGTLFRRSAGAVTAVIGLVVMPLVLSLVLPLTLATWLLRLTPAAAFTLQGTVPHYSQVSYNCAPYHGCFPLDPWPGYAVLAAWALAALAGAVYLLRRRDV